MEIFLGIVLIVLAAIVIVCVLMQSGKDKKLSSTLTGAAEGFASKGKAKDKLLSRITTILSIVFVVVAVIAVIVIGNMYGK